MIVIKLYRTTYSEKCEIIHLRQLHLSPLITLTAVFFLRLSLGKCATLLCLFYKNVVDV